MEAGTESRFLNYRFQNRRHFRAVAIKRYLFFGFVFLSKTYIPFLCGRNKMV